MKKAKTLRINFDLRFDTRYVFNLKQYCTFKVVANNCSFRIKTDAFGLAMYCIDEKQVKVFHDEIVHKTLSSISIIKADSKCISFKKLNKHTQNSIENFLRDKIKESNANSNAHITNACSNTAKAKRKNRQQNIRSYAIALANRLRNTKNLFINLLNLDRFSLKEFRKIYSKVFDEILSYMTQDEVFSGVSMKKSIITLLNQGNI